MDLALQVLMNHIRDKLPDMKARLNTLMGQAQQELNSFGDEAIYGDTNQVYTVLLLFIMVSDTLNSKARSSSAS